MKKFLFILVLACSTFAFGQEFAHDSISKPWDIRCFPNPTSDLLIITSSEELDQILLFDINGSAIKAGVLPNNCFSLHEIPSGWVFIYLEARDGRIEKKTVWKN